MLSISPSQVRARILAEHAAIRERLDRVTQVIPELKANNEISVLSVLAEVHDLYRVLLAHLDFEDALLEGTLKTIDAWGTVRASKLADHHAEQRAQLRNLIERTNAASAEELAGLLGQLIEELRQDMQAEESDVLSAQLLRDDVIAVEAEGG